MRDSRGLIYRLVLVLLCAPLAYRAWYEFDRSAATTPHVELPPCEERFTVLKDRKASETPQGT